MKLPRLFKKKERLICIEVLEDMIRGVFVRFDPESQQVEVVRRESLPLDFSHDRAELMADELDVLLSRLETKRKKERIIIGFYNRAAVTTRANEAVNRTQAGELIQEAELEDMLFKAQWRIFDDARAAMTTRMGIGDLDLHLTDAKVESVRLDGHRVINPVGFRSRVVQFDIANTFVSKRVISAVKDVLHEKQSLDLIIESNAALANSLLRLFKQDSGIIIVAGDSATQVLVVSANNLVYNQDFGWGRESIINTLSRTFGIADDVSSEILYRYINGMMSEKMRRKIDRVIAEEQRLFFEAVEIALEETKLGKDMPETIYISMETALPPSVVSRMKSYKWPSRLFSRQPETYVVSEHFLSEALQLNDKIPNVFAALLAEYIYGERGEHELNLLLNKRIRWLEV